jgi:F0F1-type ATP synthase membrane subunit c/vacuolar-type H+-ATPase subunit K
VGGKAALTQGIGAVASGITGGITAGATAYATTEGDEEDK